MLGIYEREGWAKAELELEDQRREGEAAERRWLEELGVAKGRPPSRTQVQSQGVTILQEMSNVAMRTGVLDPLQVLQRVHL